MTLSEWKNDFKGFVKSLEISRDDYKGIMEYINDVPEPHWISMRERLPSEGELVLLGDADENMTTGRLIRTDDGYKWDSDMLGWWNELGDWDAWIPLPELYKGATT